MTISVWRYSHLALAVSSSLFILLASVTGIILAFEPISNKLQSYKVSNFDEILLAETLLVLDDVYDEVIDMRVDANSFVLIDAITKEGESINGYIDPNNANFLGERIQKGKFFQVITNFHRSLFLKTVGRIFIGITSFLLFVIALTGGVLVLKRQRSLRKFFSKIVNENFSQYWHVVLGRLSLLPVIIITITGVYLSLLRFDIIPEVSADHVINFDNLQSAPVKGLIEFPALSGVMLSEVRAVEFPFSSDVEDYYTIQLKNKELVINQYTGETISEVTYPLVNVFTNLSVVLHTGEGTVIWALILAIACVNIVFFMYSGFTITMKRRKTRLKNRFKPKDAEVVILVGSENGTTLVYANAFHRQLLKNNVKSYIDELNNYSAYPNANNLVIVTATYGEGEAPTNANNFINKLEEIKQPNKLTYSVVGFGSLAYPNFCKFGLDVDSILGNKEQFSRLLEVTTINDRSFENFEKWVDRWSSLHKLELRLPKEKLVTKPKRLQTLEVVQKEQPNVVDSTFTMSLKPKRRVRFASGDLLAIYPKDDYRERLYSIGRVNGEVNLGVKLHELGIGSNFLNDKKLNDNFSARIIKNEGFHFPKKSKRVILIANGTGIAPFLGMIDENKKQVETHLYWGGRKADSLAIYKKLLDKGLKSNRLFNLTICYSQEDNKEYVQDALKRDEEFIAETLRDKGVIMICGSLAMQNDVLGVLKNISVRFNKTPIDNYINNRQLKMDCY